ncbi:unnamed protein product [Ranitomeya imitator]|uniref:acetate--CoA ligase n=1 Tax=Ranitomeya imitator TaxID=111125 RepID=A0ABN9L4I7_9NEOB|nr:unnamed protein product [Ranitomeya imitator]
MNSSLGKYSEKFPGSSSYEDIQQRAHHRNSRELLDTTCRIANTLKKYGIKKGDRVAIYMPVSPLAVASMLACARIGAVHTVVFAGFSAESLAGRINDGSWLGGYLVLSRETHGGVRLELQVSARCYSRAVPDTTAADLKGQELKSKPKEGTLDRTANCKAVITFNQGLRGGRVTELKKTVDEAVKSCPSIKHVFVAQRTDNKVHMGNLDIPLEEDGLERGEFSKRETDEYKVAIVQARINKSNSKSFCRVKDLCLYMFWQEMAKTDPVCPPESMDSEDMLFMLYTSGSTGKPKGIVHTQAGYLLYASLTHKYVFDYKQGDVFGCVADIGWITGHSYVVYGPLCNGATTVLFESTPIYPDPGRYWETVERLRINQFYGAPTAIRLLLKYGDEWVKKYDRSSLKMLGSVGEPINHEAWEWFYNVVGDGRCDLLDTWWQTEFVLEF